MPSKMIEWTLMWQKNELAEEKIWVSSNFLELFGGQRQTGIKGKRQVITTPIDLYAQNVDGEVGCQCLL